MATSKAAASNNLLERTALRITRTHFVYVAVYALTVIIFDTWNLLTHEVVGQRWTAAIALLVVTTLVWYGIRLSVLGKARHLILIWLLILADIGFASWNVYTQRGMASKAVMLFVVPIISAALLRSRSTLLTATILSSAAYTLAATKYFYNNYGEGFRVELYGEVFISCALFFVFAWLLLVFITNPDKR